MKLFIISPPIKRSLLYVQKCIVFIIHSLNQIISTYILLLKQYVVYTTTYVVLACTLYTISISHNIFNLLHFLNMRPYAPLYKSKLLSEESPTNDRWASGLNMSRGITTYYWSCTVV